MGLVCAIICTLIIVLKLFGIDPVELGKNQLFVIASVGLVGFLVFLGTT